MTTMDCPDCGHERTRVVDTGASDATTVRRRRECADCGFRFTTYERPEWETLQVKKRSGEVEPYDRGKLRAGVERAVEKRPIDESEVIALVDDVEERLRETDGRVVRTSRIGDLVAERLRDLDAVAYVRFVSVYEAFSDPEEFLREVERVLDDGIDGSDSDSDGDSVPDADSSADTDADAGSASASDHRDT